MGEYVYGIIERKNAPKNFNIKGIEDSDVYTINYQDLTAVASKAPMKEYEPTEDATEKHKQVSLHVLENYTVLPVAFGMVFKSRGILINTMRKVYPLLKKNLRLIDNKIELGVKTILPKDIEVFESKTGKSKEDYIKTCEEEFVNNLGKIAVQSKNGKLFSERLAFNKSFLVEKDKIDNFSAELEKLGNKYNPLKIQYTGPWPAYNFVDIKIMSRGR
ncbi:MAG: GvpL/GvpF family gas vesicle protein [Nanoarchaeota archaeon]|nr:GvpL/GvpF family gas vesicle protein [Nanoarchaeota archaeon]